MKFFVIERVRNSSSSVSPGDFAKVAADDLRYKLQLMKSRKIVGGGPFLDTVGDGYIVETETLEELGEILFGSPANFVVDREVHPLGTFADSLEGMEELRKKPR
ncbi:MAG TPA: hypothetical protein VEC02_05385 [Nitrososphaerales archaeon]|nr:hypothetical protein [Nitrososphaerales archaeon]